ncbi:immunity 8 family protein, partial [Leptospira sp. SA-E8]|uniref:immunity 8 family protein n=1 Tax=Leptospira sp. SA-E8 TaxID=3422259 RepID=UPI003EC0CC30
EDLSTYMPQIPDNFCVWLTLAIGPEETEGSHLFQVGVCTVSWLENQLSVHGAYVLRHLILVESFDFELIKKTISEIIAKAERPTWEQSVPILSRYFAWEYEDYQP